MLALNGGGFSIYTLLISGAADSSPGVASSLIFHRMLIVASYTFRIVLLNPGVSHAWHCCGVEPGVVLKTCARIGINHPYMDRGFVRQAMWPAF